MQVEPKGICRANRANRHRRSLSAFRAGNVPHQATAAFQALLQKLFDDPDFIKAVRLKRTTAFLRRRRHLISFKNLGFGDRMHEG